ncbi:MAG: hypothetical protein AAF657_01895 [Acidobacteriota bacterium]
MSGSDWQRQALQQAAAVAESRRREIAAARTPDEPPSAGDLYVFDQAADHGVQWLVVEEDSGDGLLAVASDLDREVGSADIAASASFSATSQTASRVTIRCRFAVFLPVAACNPSRRTGRLADGDLRRVRDKLRALTAGTLEGTPDEQESDSESVYEDLVEELVTARDALVAGIEGALPAAETAPAIRLSGVDAATGQALLPAVALAAVAERVRNEVQDRLLLEWLRRVHRSHSQPSLGPAIGIDAADVAWAGWALVLPAVEAADLRSALEPLIAHRRRSGAVVKVLQVHADEDWREWLARHEVAVSEPVEPEKLPYYLLIAGSPERISFAFQQALATQYAVGRVCFEDPSSYRRYADSVVAAETAPVPPTSRRAIVFAPRQVGDSIRRSTGDLVAELLAEGSTAREVEPVRLLGAEATRARLIESLKTEEGSRRSAPALWLAASHSLGWQPGHPEQLASQGALVCQDWPFEGAVEAHQVFAARDVPRDAALHGSIVLLAAPFSAGTPERDELLQSAEDHAPRLAERPFVASLPQRLLDHPGGGVLAVVGLVDRSWGAAVAPSVTAQRWQPLRLTVDALLGGQPVGHAVGELHRRHAALASELAELRRQMRFGRRIDPRRIADLWFERNAVRGYVVLGDPAVRRRSR